VQAAAAASLIRKRSSNDKHSDESEDQEDLEDQEGSEEHEQMGQKLEAKHEEVTVFAHDCCGEGSAHAWLITYTGIATWNWEAHAYPAAGSPELLLSLRQSLDAKFPLPGSFSSSWAMFDKEGYELYDKSNFTGYYYSNSGLKAVRAIATLFFQALRYHSGSSVVPTSIVTKGEFAIGSAVKTSYGVCRVTNFRVADLMYEVELPWSTVRVQGQKKIAYLPAHQLTKARQHTAQKPVAVLVADGGVSNARGSGTHVSGGSSTAGSARTQVELLEEGNAQRVAQYPTSSACTSGLPCDGAQNLSFRVDRHILSCSESWRTLQTSAFTASPSWAKTLLLTWPNTVSPSPSPTAPPKRYCYDFPLDSLTLISSYELGIVGRWRSGALVRIVVVVRCTGVLFPHKMHF
jgi:hypothetical protein